MRVSTVFLLDVDNTLLDNDRFNADLAREITGLIGAERSRAFHALYERTRQELGFVDYPEVLRRFGRADPAEPRFTEVAATVLGHSFAEYVFPGALEAIRAVARDATPVILSDGDLVFQAAKIGRSGLARAVDGRVLIFEHKEERLDDVCARFPADRYVLVDDKPRILAAVKARQRQGFRTVFVRQGKYAREPADGPPPDATIARIADLATVRV